MNLSTIFFTLLYGGAIVFIILYLFRSQQPPVVIYPVATTIDYPNVVYSDSSWWPWSVSSYNGWPYWSGWWSGGGGGGYGYWRRGHHRHHGGIRPISRPGGTISRPSGGIRSGSIGGRGGGPRGGTSGGRR